MVIVTVDFQALSLLFFHAMIILSSTDNNLNLSTFCGKNIPRSLNSKDNSLTVKFMSDDITPSTSKYTTGVEMEITAFCKLKI